MGLTASERVGRLVGFDTAGEVFISGDRILRGIYPGDAAAVRDVLSRCEQDDLFGKGIVSTRELAENPHPELGYEAVLEHERVPFVSYPHEWPASMLRDAALFHIDLFQQLGNVGLTLKDWHPYNVLFEGATPKFVDFTSIIPVAALASQPHLRHQPPKKGIARFWDETSAAMYESYRLMYEPFFGLPMAMMRSGGHVEARRRLYETALNSSSSVMSRREVFGSRLVRRFSYELGDRRLRLALLERDPAKRRFFSLLRKMVAGSEVAVKGSKYTSYYEEKKEAFSTEPSPEWTTKQRSVRYALAKHAPATVLDVGSNTGWFSILAAGMGASVVAVDLDEACVDALYRRAKRESLPILALVANLTAPVKDRHALVFPEEPSLSLIGGNEPLYPAPNARLRCDMVMALAVVHHLVLGEGLSFERVAAIFGGLAKKYLCVEFVELGDPMISTDPSFFPAFKKSPERFAWYTLQNFVAALQLEFSSVEVLPSHPATRAMVILSKQVS